MQVRLHELAAKEFDEAIEWYELQQKGLGTKFKTTVLNQLNKIKLNSNWFLIEDSNLHKAYIPKFPYKILYTVDNDIIIIWAFAHLHRKPFYWQSRVN